MRLTVKELIRKVRICIDEIALNDAEFTGTQDNTEMDTIIREKILEALRYIHEKASPEYLEPDIVLTSGTAEGMTVDSRLVGHLALPDDLLRVVYARFQSWPLHVTDYILWGDPEYAMLHDPYATGTWERPKVALLRTPTWKLELYSAYNADDGWEVGLLTLPKIDDDDGEETVGVSERLLPSLIYYLSGLTLLTYGEQRADDMFNLALSLMGIATSAQPLPQQTG